MYDPYIPKYRSRYGSYDPYIAQHRRNYGSYDPYTAQHRSKNGSYDPNIAQHTKKYRKFEIPFFCRKFQILKMTQKSFSAYPKKPKIGFFKKNNFLYKIPHFYPPRGALLYMYTHVCYIFMFALC